MNTSSNSILCKQPFYIWGKTAQLFYCYKYFINRVRNCPFLHSGRLLLLSHMPLIQNCRTAKSHSQWLENCAAFFGYSRTWFSPLPWKYKRCSLPHRPLDKCLNLSGLDLPMFSDTYGFALANACPWLGMSLEGLWRMNGSFHYLVNCVLPWIIK